MAELRKLLIANRGAVAARVQRAARQLGMSTVCVFSDADADLPYLDDADERHRIGPAPAPQSYLSVEAVIDAARRSGADAVHPGYGFLSENADFAEAVQQAGLLFVGPDARWLRQMGHKTRARTLMAGHGMPVCPSSDVLRGSLDERVSAAASVGFPLMVKPAGGGGGIGMQAVENADALGDALERAGKLAARSFGSDEVYVERLLTRPRHIEFQIVGDRHGDVRHLFERDCSLQRRHQKVIEEARAPLLPEAELDAMGERAASILRKLGYDNLGTVEMLHDAAVGFSFLEINTRLQVEHGVTEEITGVDLVQAQIRLAAGARLSEVFPERVVARGHAIQLRLYAEDPVRFLPAPGRLEVFDMPSLPGVRIETGYRQGNQITPFYDPMIGKLIATATDRASAIELALRAIDATRIEGVKTNLPFLRKVLQSSEFRAGDVHTGLAAQIAKAPAATT
ncbi:MAG: acetyl/propionyl/methylcrotonyl-CoA carboxylase subunit alpha [Burkholderiaceae bacterium]